MKTCTICPGKHDMPGALCPRCQGQSDTIEKIGRIDHQLGEMQALVAMIEHCRNRLAEIEAAQ